MGKIDHSEYKRRQAEILNKLHYENVAHLGQTHASNDSHVLEATKALNELFLEVVGEDVTKWVEATPSQRTVAESTNDLRASIRQTVTGEVK